MLLCGRSAVEYGCTHVLVLRSYPDGKLLPKSLLGLFERLVAPKCLDPFPEVSGHFEFRASANVEMWASKSIMWASITC
jgi:hypothetical protein